MSLLKNSIGTTLIELSASLMILSVTSLVAISLIHITATYSRSLQDEINATNTSISIEYSLKRYLSLAVQIVPSGDRNDVNETFKGELLDVTCASRTDCPNWTELAFFNRENSTGGLSPATPELDIAPTRIWYKGPRHDVTGNNSAPGVLVIDNGFGANPDGRPDIEDEYYADLSYFASKPVTSGTEVSKIKYELRVRYHGPTQVKSWCSYEDINSANCNFNSGRVPNFYDKEHNFTVNLINNLLSDNIGDGSGLEVRLLGPIHFFKAIFPGEY